MKLGRLEGLNKKGRFLSPSTSLDTIVTVEIEILSKPSYPAVSGVISGKLILAAEFFQCTILQGFAQCFDFDRDTTMR